MKGRCCANYSFDATAKQTQLNDAKIRVECNGLKGFLKDNSGLFQLTPYF